MSVTIILGTICAAIIIYHVIRIHRKYSFFSKRNVAGPVPMFFFGNLFDIYTSGGCSNLIKKWSEEFGDNYGYFVGRTPVFVVSDLAILKEVFKNQTAAFHSRKPFPLEDRRASQDVHLFSATGHRWERQRKIIVRLFHILKSKCMFSTIDESVTNMLNKLSDSHKQCQEGFDIYQMYKCLTMEVIWRCCFGVRTDMQNDQDNEYFVRSQQVFDRQHGMFVMGFMSVCLPELQSYFLVAHYCINSVKSLLRRILPIAARLIDEDPSEWLKKHINKLATEITNNQNGSNDMNMNQTSLLHLMRQVTKEYSSSEKQVRKIIDMRKNHSFFVM